MKKKYFKLLHSNDNALAELWNKDPPSNPSDSEPGPPGPQGEKGDKGDKGDPGEILIIINPPNTVLFNLNLYNESFEEWGFEENFEQNWFMVNQFNNLFTENFTWMEQLGEYTQLIQETFQQDWFIFNQYGMNILTESFDNLWFTINNYNSNIFVENWEGSDWI